MVDTFRDSIIIKRFVKWMFLFYRSNSLLCTGGQLQEC